MKIALFVILLAVSTFAQVASNPPFPVACGPEKMDFTVRLADPPAEEQLEPGKARVYFIQDSGLWGDYEHFTLTVGLDGAWVGAYKHNSYFAVSVDPGEHHLCAKLQSSHVAGRVLTLAHFMAEPGTTYYFRTRFPRLGQISNAPSYVDLQLIDSDEGKYLIASYPLSIAQPKK